jgi:hypothetical protein
MADIPMPTLWDEILNFLAEVAAPEQVIAFQASPALQARASELLERNRENTLTPEEKAELEEFARINHLVSMLKIRARKKLAGS